MDAQLTFGLELGRPRAGWMDVAVLHSGQRTLRAVSYVTDALGDLLRACDLLWEGSAHERVDWEGEPAVYRWELVRVDDRVEVRFDEYEDDEEAERGTVEAVLFRGEVPLREFCAAVAGAARDLVTRVGEDRYVAEWRARFPLVELHRLERRVLGGPSTHRLFLGSDADDVAIELVVARAAEPVLDCGVGVSVRGFTGAVESTMRLDELAEFVGALTDQQSRVVTSPSLTTADGACRFVVERNGAVVRLRGALEDAVGQKLEFVVPLSDDDVHSTTVRAQDTLRWLVAGLEDV